MTRRGLPLLSAGPDRATGSMPMVEAVNAIRAAGCFDEAFYLDRYAAIDPVLKLVDPISHYLAVGAARGFRPSAQFDASTSVMQNPDLVPGGMNPLLRLSLARRRAGAPTAPPAKKEQAPPRRARGRDTRPDFSGLRRPWADGARVSLDVIMPVYAGLIQTLGAIHAVLASRNKTAFELIVIDDASPDQDLVEHLRQIAGLGLITLIRNTQNLGFAATVNRGFARNPSRDVLLLNSDTVVHGNWLDRMAAHARPGVATVTPFSNNASLCSYPRIFEANDLPQSVTARMVDRLCAKLNKGQSAEVPTGVGFCMLVPRAAFTAIGEFDAATFGKGYGEDNDFCLRALKAGFCNLHALDVFVHHEGGVSFAAVKRAETLRPLAALNRKHMAFKARLRRFAVDDPACAARQLLDLGLLSRRKKCIVVLPPGGTDMKRRKTVENATVTLHLHPEPAGPGFRVEPMPGSPPAPNLKAVPPDHLKSLLARLRNSRPQLRVVFRKPRDTQRTGRP